MRVIKMMLGIIVTVATVTAMDLPKPMNPEMMEKLGLDPEKSKQIREMIQSTRPQMQALREEVQSTRREIGDLMTNPATSEGQIRSAVQKSARAHEEMLVLMVKTRNQIDGLLTPEQREKFHAMHAKWKGKQEERREKFDNKREEFREKAQKRSEGRRAKFSGSSEE